MTRPRLLDLFCGAGGCSVGYERAGFDVVGVDIKPQPRYPFEFWQADAIEALLDFDTTDFTFGPFHAIHASCPCQFATAGGNIWLSRLGPADERHPNLIEPTRELILATGLPYVIENVERAAKWLRHPYMLCGRAFGLGVKRHRLFECNFPMIVPACPPGHPGDWISVFGGGALSRTPPRGQARVNGKHNGRGAYDGRVHVPHEKTKVAMGIDWMTRDELSQSIPPAMTEHVGHYLMAEINARAAA